MGVRTMEKGEEEMAEGTKDRVGKKDSNFYGNLEQFFVISGRAFYVCLWFNVKQPTLQTAYRRRLGSNVSLIERSNVNKNLQGLNQTLSREEIRQ